MLYRTLILSMHLQTPIEYIGQALELVASLRERVQRSINLLSLYKILVISFSLHFMSSNFLLIN